MNNPIVTVIIPAYNHEAYISESIESVFKQTYKNIQLIVINDGSTDNTKQVIQEILDRKTNEFTFISKKNEGLIKTLNLGISLAQGTYFCVLASDDFWMPDKIARQVEVMEKNPEAGLTFSDTYFCYGFQKTDVKYSKYKPGLLKIKSGVAVNLYNRLLIENLVISTTNLIRLDALKSVGNFDDTLTYEDYDMWLRISYKYRIIYLNEPMAYYRIHEANFSKQNLKMLKGATGTLEKQYALLKKDHSFLFIFSRKLLFFVILALTKMRKRKIIHLIKKITKPENKK